MAATNSNPVNKVTNKRSYNNSQTQASKNNTARFRQGNYIVLRGN